MNLDELRQAMASDATAENKNLKYEIEDLKKKLKKKNEKTILTIKNHYLTIADVWLIDASL